MLDTSALPSFPTGTALSAEEASRRERLLAHRRHLRALPRPGRDETSDLVARFLATGGSVTRCAPAYLVPCQAR